VVNDKLSNKELDFLRRKNASAKASLDQLKNALLQKNSDSTGLATIARSIASDLEFHNYVRWLDHEIAGYAYANRDDDAKAQQLGQLLGLKEGDELLDQVTAYRRQTGKVTLSNGNGIMEPLPYPWFFTEPLAELETRISRLDQDGEWLLTINSGNLPQSGIRNWLLQFNIQKMPVVFAARTFIKVIAGFRAQLGKVVVEFESSINFNDQLLEMDQPKLQAPAPIINNNTFINSPVASLNQGHQGTVTVSQNINNDLAKITDIIADLTKGKRKEETQIGDEIRDLLHEALLQKKTDEEIKAAVSAIAIHAKKNGVGTNIMHWVKEIPLKLMEHWALGEVIHNVLPVANALVHELPKYLPHIGG
jgi:hypothetical protein